MDTLTLHNGALSFSAMACGRVGDPVVLCLHGFPDDPSTFDALLPALAAAGYRAIAPHMRGYEPSCQPEDGDYSIGAIARDVLAFVDALGQPVHLIGHDWGAVVTYAAGALGPDRFRSLTTMAVPHVHRLPQGVRRVPRQLGRSWYQLFFQIPGLSDWAIERDDWALVRWLWQRWSPGHPIDGEAWTRRRATFERPGVKRAMLSYYRQNLSPGVILGWRRSEARELTVVPVRTLAITGALDGCMDTRLYEHVFDPADFPAGHRVVRIEEGGHFVHIDAPERVRDVIVPWLAGG